ncbi:MAG: histidine kinase dimerization/phosphoacceptor domain -containing protein, partial [Spirochaetaceae bacterium]|nr:histidine kinase dimerization/phosphoacceptor domain -containing protein [Spirochaetaceae bacterium]
MKGKTEFAKAYLVAGLSVAVAVAGATFVLGYSLAHRLGENLDAAGRSLREQAALVAESFDSALRTADIVLEYAATGLAGDHAAIRGRMAAAASFLASGEGLYAYDGDGRPIAVFPPVTEPPPLDPGLAARLRSGARAETMIATTAGGTRVLVARSLGASAQPFAGALVASFGSSALNESVLGLLGTGVDGIDVLDARGEIAFSRPIGSATSPSRTDAEGWLTASVALKTHPLSVALYRPREAIVALWRQDAILTAIMTSLVLVLVFALGAYALALGRKSEKNRELLKSLEYRSTLFKELNHRVKNNLAMVSGFLSLAETEAE